MSPSLVQESDLLGWSWSRSWSFIFKWSFGLNDLDHLSDLDLWCRSLFKWSSRTLFPLDFRPLPLLRLGQTWNNHDFMTWYSTECKCFYRIQSRELEADISWGELSHVIISTSSDKIQDCMKIHAEEARHLMVFGNSERRDESTDDRLLMKVINKLILTRIK